MGFTGEAPSRKELFPRTFSQASAINASMSAVSGVFSSRGRPRPLLRLANTSVPPTRTEIPQKKAGKLRRAWLSYESLLQLIICPVSPRVRKKDSIAKTSDFDLNLSHFPRVLRASAVSSSTHWRRTSLPRFVISGAPSRESPTDNVKGAALSHFAYF